MLRAHEFLRVETLPWSHRLEVIACLIILKHSLNLQRRICNLNVVGRKINKVRVIIHNYSLQLSILASSADSTGAP